MTFLDVVGIVWGLPLIAWVVWGYIVEHRETLSESNAEWEARMKKAEDDYKAGVPPPKKSLFWRINDKAPDPYKFGK